MQLIAIITFIVVFGATVVRWVNKGVASNHNDRLLTQARGDAMILSELIDRVEMTYASFEFSGFDAVALSHELKSSKLLRGFEILEALPLPNKLLLYAESNYEDWETKLDGNPGVIKQSRTDFFCIKPDPTQKRLFICGPMFNDNTEKLVFKKFAEHLKKSILSL